MLIFNEYIVTILLIKVLIFTSLCVNIQMEVLITMSFKDAIYNLRTGRGLSQIEFAKMIGSSQASITAWENGIRIPPIKTLQEISDIFHVPVEELIGETSPDDDTLRIARVIQAREGLRLLFEKANKMSDRDIDAMNAVAAAIVRENY